MKTLLRSIVLAAFAWSSSALATGLATCDSGPQENWRAQAELEQELVRQGWEVRRIKIDGGCYEVYALDENGDRVEAYFHPDTLAPVPVGDE